jgi:hypothetical protein
MDGVGMNPQQVRAKKRRDLILSTLKEKGPCLANYLLWHINAITKQGIDNHVFHRDIKSLRDNREIKTENVIGLLEVDLRRRAQKMLLVRLPKEKK